MSLELAEAIRTHKNHLLPQLISKLSDINIKIPPQKVSADGCVSFLHIAAETNNVEAIRLLLRQPNILKDPTTDRSRTPLHYAAIYGHSNACQELLGTSNAAAKDKSGMTAFDYAKNGLKVTRHQIESRKNIKLLKIPTFVDGCGSGFLDVVMKMVDENININSYYKRLTGLMVACIACQKEVVRYLASLKEKIDINLRFREEGWTALHFACMPFGTEFLKDPESITSKALARPKEAGKSWSPLPRDEQSLRVEIANLLIEGGAEVDAVDASGETPLYSSVVCNELELVRLLAIKGANFHKKVVIEGKIATPFRVAELGRPEIYQFMLEYEAGRYFPNRIVMAIAGAPVTRETGKYPRLFFGRYMPEEEEDSEAQNSQVLPEPFLAHS